MSTFAPAPENAKSALFARLIDDASLFPPAQLSLSAALRAHARNRESAYAFVQGAFVVPASRLGELEASRDPALPLRLAVLCDGTLAGDMGAAEAIGHRDGVQIEAFEIKAPAAMIDVGSLAPTTVWLEAPYDGGWLTPPDQTLTALAALRAKAPAGVRIGAKVRCGGATAAQYPSVEDLAAFVIAAQTCGVPWKATAGLHHPIRHKRADTSFGIHGFVNLALAAYALHAGAIDAAGVRELLADEDASHFSIDPRQAQWRGVVLDVAALAAARAATFASYGSCSFAEPVIDLVRLGVFE